MIGETMRRFNAFFPNAAAGTGIIFGNFNQIPIISLEHDPAVDFKYFLDMQVNLIANSPDFAGLATTGYWGTYYGDEELVRWSFLLMRHYAVEGHKDMLSARYGFKYNPGFLANGDFADGLKGWTASPAADGSIRTDTIAGYGKNSQGRWGGGNAGDTVCVLTRQAGQPNRISQTAQGLDRRQSLLPAIRHRRPQGRRREEVQPAPLRHRGGTGRRRDPPRQELRPHRPAQRRPLRPQRQCRQDQPQPHHLPRQVAHAGDRLQRRRGRPGRGTDHQLRPAQTLPGVSHVKPLFP